MTKMWWGGVDFGRLGIRATARALALVALLAAALFMAVPDRAEAQTFRFSQFVVEGNQRVDPGTVLSYANLTRGQAISAAQLNAAVQDIQASGLFESVEVEPRGGTLLIRVVEFPTINRIAFEGNRRLDDDALGELVRSSPRRVFSPTQVEQDTQRIVEAYETQGRIAASVEPRIIRRSDNRVDVVFEIAEGRVVENERISFVGNRAFTDRRLRRILETKQAGLLRAFFRTDTFVADRLEFDRRILTDFYFSRGYVDFQVLDISTELSRERDATFITVQVREGQQFRFGELTATSDLPEIDPEEYLAAGRLRSGVVYSPTIVEAAINRMEGLATRRGLDFVRFEPRVVRDDRNLTLDIEFVITRGPRIFVERIDIEGNQTTLDRVIRRQFTSVEGDPFNPRAIRNAASRIRALNYFETVDVASREGSSPEQVIVDVDVEERPTGQLGVGASYSSDAGVGVTLNFRETNFLGRGQIIDVDISNTSDTANSQIVFTEPALLSRNLSLTLSAFLLQAESNNSEFDTRNLGASIGVAFPIGEFSTLGLSYGYSQLDLNNVSVNSSPILIREQGERSKSALSYTYTYDTRNRGNDPNAGILLSFGQEFAGLGGDVEYIKTTGRAIAQRRLRNEDYTLRAIVEGGNVSGLGNYQTRVNDRFFLSTNQLRGFEFRGVGPRDLGAVNQDALGGNNYVAARFEFGFPIGFAEDAGISGGLFLDVGSVWGLDDTNGAGGPGSVDDSFSLRSAVGISIFWDTPFGPLAFNFSEAISSEDFDEDRSFDISISTQF